MKACSRCKAAPRIGGNTPWCRECHNESVRNRKRLLAQRCHIETPERKSCSACKVEKASSEFAVHRGQLDGLQANCKNCKAASERRRQKKNAARATIVVPDTKRCTACKETLSSDCFASDPRNSSGLMGACRDCRTKQFNRYVRTNGKAKHKQRVSRYKRTPGGKITENLGRQRRRARLADGTSPGVTKVDWLATLEYFNHRCAYCLGPAETIDHVQAIARGGLDCADNIVPACNICNASKCEKTVLECLLDSERVVTQRMLSVA